MNAIKLLGGVTTGVLLSACVTINVYFPAAAAERAADRIIDEVWGEQTGRPAGETEPQSRLGQTFLVAVLDVLVPAAQAQAQADLEISTPAIERLTTSMSRRHEQLKPFYESGAVGQTGDGLVALRDVNAVPLKDRAQVNNLVQQENQDRNALYREIAQANGHPEWEADIRATFARRWTERAAREGWK